MSDECTCGTDTPYHSASCPVTDDILARAFSASRPRWDHATLDEVLRRRNGFYASWGEVISKMRAETTEPNPATEEPA